MKKICFIAPSGYGKSTAIKILSKKYRIKNIKIAEPLYYIQNYFYDFINTKMKGEQDGELLQFLGAKIRKENPNFLIDIFSKKIEKNINFDGIITNDDCRPPDYKYLKNIGFIFVKINGYRRDRVDHSKVNDKSSLEWQNNINYDYVVDNLGDINEFSQNLDSLFCKLNSY